MYWSLLEKALLKSSTPNSATLWYDRVQEPYRGRARFVQKLTFCIVTRPKFQGLSDAIIAFKIVAGALGFFPAKREFCPFCHIYARALSPKIIIPQVIQAKINIFFVEFQEISNAACTCQLIVRGTCVFSRQMSIFRLFPKKKIENGLSSALIV